MNNSKNVTIHYSFVQGAYWMGFSCISAFASVYLLNLGISNSLIGLTLSLGALASVITQPFIGVLIDSNPKFTTKKVLLSTAIIIFAFSLLLYPVSKGIPAIVPAMYGILIWMLQLAQPFSNSIGMASLNAGYKLNFGPARAIGSLAYAFVAFALGKLSNIYGGNIVPGFIALAFALSAISLFIYPLKEKSQIEASSSNEFIEKPCKNADLSTNDQISQKSSIADFFRKYKTLPIIIIGMTLIYFSHIVLNSFALQIVTPIGGTSETMGVATAFSAGIEVLPMFLFPILIKKFKLSSMVKLSAIFFTLKIIATTFATNITIYYAAQLCQILGWGVMAVAIVYFVNDLVDESYTAQGQAYAGISLTIANVIGNVTSGRIIDSFGIHTLLIIGSICATIGTVVFWFGVDISKSRKSR